MKESTPLPILIAAKSIMLDYVKHIEPTTTPTGIRTTIPVWFTNDVDKIASKCAEFINHDLSAALQRNPELILEIYIFGKHTKKSWFYNEVELHYKIII